MPVWGAILLAVAVAFVTQVGAGILQFKRHKHESDAQGKALTYGNDSAAREEWHRNLRWATELIAKGGQPGQQVGIAILDALDDRAIATGADQALIDHILEAMTDLPEDEPDDITSDNARGMPLSWWARFPRR